MTLGFVVRLMILMLASFLGAEVTRRVPADRRGPVSQLTVALSGAVVVAAILAAGRTETRFGAALGILAVMLATVHVVAAFFLGRRGVEPPDAPEPSEPVVPSP